MSDVAEMERQRDVSGLMTKLEHPNQAVCLESVCALLRLGAAAPLVMMGESVVDLLVKALQQPDDVVRHQAVGALRKIGDLRATGALRQAQAQGWIRDVVLYVEDNVENRLLVKTVLETWGFTVLEAKDGRRGLQLALQTLPDLILLDMNLPGMDGYQVVRRLKANEASAPIPVVALTAKVMKGDKEKSLAAGCDDYIPKPIDVDLLPQQIDRFIKQRRREASD